jgi:glycerophosphoryl diester phosphodiesterase
LQCIYANAGGRPIIFSSFSPEACILLSLKQPNYPVFLLTEGGTGVPPKDPRCSSLQGSVRFAKTTGLLGIVTDSTPLVQAPKLARAIKETGLVLFSYGEKNNNVEAVKLQLELAGVDAVIVDHVAQIRKGLYQ